MGQNTGSWLLGVSRPTDFPLNEILSEVELRFASWKIKAHLFLSNYALILKSPQRLDPSNQLSEPLPGHDPLVEKHCYGAKQQGSLYAM